MRVKNASGVLREEIHALLGNVSTGAVRRHVGSLNSALKVNSSTSVKFDLDVSTSEIQRWRSSSVDH